MYIVTIKRHLFDFNKRIMNISSNIFCYNQTSIQESIDIKTFVSAPMNAKVKD